MIAGCAWVPSQSGAVPRRVRPGSASWRSWASKAGACAASASATKATLPPALTCIRAPASACTDDPRGLTFAGASAIFTRGAVGAHHRNSRSSVHARSASSSERIAPGQRVSTSRVSASSAAAGAASRASTSVSPGGKSSASNSNRVFAASVKIRTASAGVGAASRSVHVAAGRGNTLNVISASTPNRPRLPTKNFGRSKPAAFFTTFPPRRSSRPAPSTKRTPRMKSRTPPKRKRPGPLSPAATVPPSVAPASASTGSKGRYCPRSASAAAISRTGVPAAAVNVNSLGSYSLIPRKPAVESRTASTAERRGFVPAPTASTRGTERTASASSAKVVGARRAFIRGK